MPTRPTSTRNNLVALGSAAVLAVYTAGYVRTRSAAELFANESRERMPIHPAPQHAVASTMLSDSAGPKPMKAASAPAVKSAAKAKPARQQDTRVAASPEPAPAPVKAPTAPDSSVPVAASPTIAPASPVVTAADSVAKDTTRLGPYKDGTYRGYGTSRHGDIEAELVIKRGQIYSARISQCLTRYSCSWISPLPPEVIARQSAEVDYVSGATESTYAFYYAVVEALSKAK